MKHEEHLYFQQRRRLLCGSVALSCALVSKRVFSSVAISDSVRVAALEWAGIEMLDALAITPYAVTDKRGYQNWVKQPKISPQSIDVGLQNEPNLELLADLAPDLIILNNFSGLPIERLETIAPVWRYPFYIEGKTLLDVARDNILQLAEKVGKQNMAKAYLQWIDQQFLPIRQNLSVFSGQRVLLMTLMNSRQVLILGKNSLFGELLEQAGLSNAWQGETGAWGSTIVGIEQLIYCQPDITLHLSQHDSSLLQKLSSSPIWQQMPFNQRGHFYTIPPVWLYGGLYAALIFARYFLNVTESMYAT